MKIRNRLEIVGFFFFTGGFIRPQIISFNCILKNKAGQLISKTYNRDVLNLESINLNDTLSGLAPQLQDLKKGERRIVELKAEQAYGLYDPKKVILFPLKKMPGPIQKGQSVTIAGKSGKLRTYRIVDIHDDFVSLDGNHPLAGQDLIFEIEALAARDATADEISESMNGIATQLLH